MMVTHRSFTKSLFATAILAMGIAGCSSMQASNKVTLSAQMTAAQEVPATASSGTGTAEAWLNKDTNLLTWKVSFSGLTGPATAAHFHGPAVPGSNAGVVVPFTGTTSPLEGQATLTPAQAADLLAGKWYANVHTAANKGGEIRGQMVPKM